MVPGNRTGADEDGVPICADGGGVGGVFGGHEFTHEAAAGLREGLFSGHQYDIAQNIGATILEKERNTSFIPNACNMSNSRSSRTDNAERRSSRCRARSLHDASGAKCVWWYV